MIASIRHYLKFGHQPKWIELSSFHKSCETCVFRGGPKRRLRALVLSPQRSIFNV